MIAICKHDRCHNFEPVTSNHVYCTTCNCKRKAETQRKRLETPVKTYDEETWELEERRKLARAERAREKNKWILSNRSFAFFDLETTNLNANIGEILCAAVKPRGKRAKIFQSVKSDEEIIEQIRDELEKYDYVTTYYGCPTPGQRVLTADLKWEKAEKAQSVFGFDAYTKETNRAIEDKVWIPGHSRPIGGLGIGRARGRRRHFKLGEIVHNKEVITDIWEVVLEDGTKLTVSGEHPWLIGGTWVKTRNLNMQLNGYSKKGGSTLTRLITPWEPFTGEDLYKAGWLAGFFDGEGFVVVGNPIARSSKTTLRIGAGQNPGPTLNQALKYLEDLGFSAKAGTDGFGLILNGTQEEKLRFLGQVRPNRLLNKFLSYDEFPALKQKGKRKRLKVIDVKYLGKGPVVGLGTTTETYLLEGFGSHNTRFDIPYLNTKLLMAKKRPLTLIRHVDVYYTARWFLNLHSNRLGVVEETLFGGKTRKTRVLGQIWNKAARGDEEAMKYIVTHCRADVKILEDVFNELVPFRNLSNTAIRLFGDIPVPGA